MGDSRSAFGQELARLYAGAPLNELITAICGNCSAGRATQAWMFQALMEVPTLHSRRQLVEHWLRTFNGAVRHGSQWRVINKDGWIGHQHQLRERYREAVCPLTGDVTVTVSMEWQHMPAESAGGLAAEQDRSPRQLTRYRAELRRLGFMRSKQPPRTAKDAVMPKRPRHSNGKWAYGQHWLGFVPPPEMVRRWQSFERKKGQQSPFTSIRRKMAAGACDHELRERRFSAENPPRVGEIEALIDRISRSW